jgi:teichuronic acid exporter
MNARLFKSINTKYFRFNSISFNGVALYTFGTIFSQGMSFFFSPLIARIYSPEKFGDLGLFLSIVTIVTSISTGLYEQGIGLPKKPKIAFAIASIASALAGVYSLFLLLVLFFAFPYFKFEYFPKEWLYLVPFIVFVSSIGTVLQYILLRELKYKEITIGIISLTIGNIFGSLAFYYFGFNHFGLIGGYICSNILYFTILFYFVFSGSNFTLRSFPSFRYLKVVALRYINFPKYQMPSNLFSIVSVQIVPIIIVGLFTNLVLGYFSMALRVIKTPILLISSSIANVFRNDAINEFNANGNCINNFIKVFKVLFFLAIIPFLCLLIFVPNIISLLFGKAWFNAGIYAQILCVPLFFEFIEVPLRSVLVITENQKVQAYFQFFGTIISVLSLIVGNYMFKSSVISIACYALSCSIGSMTSIFLCYKISIDKNYLKSVFL